MRQLIWPYLEIDNMWHALVFLLCFVDKYMFVTVHLHDRVGQLEQSALLHAYYATCV